MQFRMQQRQNPGWPVQMRGLAVCSILIALCSSVAAEPYVAGTSPDRRPATAPRITEAQKSADWYSRAIAGVVAPHPQTLRFLNDQGAWYTPFNLPGMPGPYDIRGLHAPAQTGGPATAPAAPASKK